MKVIIGLGNPGSDYASTRHNLGFIMVDELAAAWRASFRSKPKLKADVAEVTINSEKVFLVKPTTFYNLAGESARAIRDYYKLKSTDFLVIHDDLSLPFGTIRTRPEGSSAGNNGIKSLNYHLGETYARIRIGIWNEHREKVEASDFVLAPITSNEKVTLDQLIRAVEALSRSFAAGTMPTTSSKLEA